MQQGQSGMIPLPRSNVFGLTSRVIQQDGLIGLWRGMTPTIARNVPGVALYFFSLAELRRFMTTIPQLSHLHSNPSNQLTHSNVTILPRLSAAGDLAAGMMARTAVGFLLMPITVVKTRFEASTFYTSSLYSYQSIRSAFVDVVKQNGLKGLWRGFVPTMIRDAPFAGLFVSTYEKSKSILQSSTTPLIISSNPTLIHMISATLGASLATLITTPFDFIKTQQQLKPKLYLNLFQSIKLILDDNHAKNWKLFFRGSSLRLIRKGLSSAIGWSI
ncbi:uncharacterized protein MELLADRAFT_116706 [Melampsora larici-populina 98AG31]|uniref:Solute carrier family 25 member 38 homolog n=1 Tax=Melampsora larici-populina (strain 98AG31 / pathotype 3-4-7) TaxID=747676 RepID=F4RP87_MELLP|nr:uncharacterized protein MELLADRAFT_116706 [Melampsora larici-populina 98AG31]EGG05894.1 hypothetical protein MELLADRAFT_116706 [Melampsora larici-populina 98AG31]